MFILAKKCYIQLLLHKFTGCLCNLVKKSKLSVARVHKVKFSKSKILFLI